MLIVFGIYYTFKNWNNIKNSILNQTVEDSDEDSYNGTVEEALSQIVDVEREKVFLDISHNNKHIGRIIIELFNDITPITAKNFAELCKNKKYQNTRFHRIIKDFMIQGGDIDNLNGKGGRSIYGQYFDDENFDIKHNQPGLVSMANKGKNTNGSQFFITTNNANHLDGKHVVFGTVIQGMNIVKIIEDTHTVDGNPTLDVYISDCGIL